jgi:hypothetical protein
VGVDERLPPATEGSDRLAPRRTTAITRRSRGRIAAGRCRAFPAAPQIHKTRPLPLKIARRVRMRKDRQIGSAALAGNSGFCASPRIGPFFQEKTFIGLPCPTSRRRKSGGDTDEKGSRLPRPIVREVSFRTPSIPRKRASQEHQPLVVVENPCVPHKSSVQFARGPSDQNRPARPSPFWCPDSFRESKEDNFVGWPGTSPHR